VDWAGEEPNAGGCGAIPIAKVSSTRLLLHVGARLILLFSTILGLDPADTRRLRS
jgi:hypothetical protein